MSQLLTMRPWTTESLLLRIQYRRTEFIRQGSTRSLLKRRISDDAALICTIGSTESLFQAAVPSLDPDLETAAEAALAHLKGPTLEAPLDRDIRATKSTIRKREITARRTRRIRGLIQKRRMTLSTLMDHNRQRVSAAVRHQMRQASISAQSRPQSTSPRSNLSSSSASSPTSCSYASVANSRSFTKSGSG